MLKIGLLLFITSLFLQIHVANAQHTERLSDDWSFLRSDLGGIWEAVRPVESGNPESLPIWDTIDLPHCYNAFDAVDPDLNYYQGPAWYRKSVKIRNPYQNGRTLLHFEGVGQKAEVYVYTTKVGEHVGGYDEWSVDITEAVRNFSQTREYVDLFKGHIPISIRVDNSRDLNMIPSNLSDFNLYGGIYRPLNLRYVPAIGIDKIFATAMFDQNTKEGKVSLKTRIYTANAIPAKAEMQVKLIDPNGEEITLPAPSMNLVEEQVIGDFIVKEPVLWSPSKPALYTLITTIKAGGDTYTERTKIGFRNIEFIKNGPFHLNGERLLLRGTHRHEDHAGVGAAMTDEMILREMKMIKDMGVNFIRLGHYQQSKTVLEACDSLGILVWEEIPWCRGGIGGDVYKEQGRRMLTNMIEQHYNHPSIIIWGIGNENDWPGDFSEFDKEKIRMFMKELHDLSHQLDPLRKTAIRRCEFCKDIVDVYSPSIWAGWYRGVYTDYKKTSEDAMKDVAHFLHVEWGGDSHARRHAENPDKELSNIKGGYGNDERAGDASLTGGAPRVSKDGDWSESYICNLIDWHLKEQETMPWLTGTAYWPFKDFSTPVRPDNPVPYVNQKGVVERDFKKKESYYVFQSYWATEPMIHIYGHSWPVRWGEANEKKMIKVYSNASEVELFVNGQSQGTRKRNSQDFPSAGLRWMVDLKEGQNHIKALAKIGNETIVDEIEQNYQTKRWSSPTQVRLGEIAREGDLITLEATLLDKDGNISLDTKKWLHFDVTGDAELLDNLGTSDGARKVQAYNGRARIKVRTFSDDWKASVKSAEIPTAILSTQNH
ncbi:glycoside hydrolase family 2 TIM barrel-domain containing protein [Sphingobacterium paludis]|uniref:Beta-galactosidase n=1 Tax=Sphingobacterium paludis TaxID=1476465 RepID=A0A4R7CTH6_9SPHI|nr:glycoside hydrolase family 2 TIM barrel-domain containing protein [Sphingobacterium paludis]TDS08926.1 beta-galactosidase [Sphingobacterium paludis]